MPPVFHTSQENLKVYSWCKFGAQIHYKLLSKQVKFSRILSQNGQNDIEVQGQWPLFSITAAGIPWCMFGLVIPAQICDELACGQGNVYGRAQATTIPIRPERPSGKNVPPKYVIVIPDPFSYIGNNVTINQCRTPTDVWTPLALGPHIFSL